MPLPQPWTVIHEHYVLNDPYEEDAHGNPKGHYLAPVTRRAVAIREQESKDVIAEDTQDRTVTDVIMAVRDPSPYSPQDRVKIDGVSFLVNGDALSDLKGLYPQYNAVLGAQIRMRRVT